MRDGTGLVRGIDLQLARKTLFIAQLDAMRRVLRLKRLRTLAIENHSTRPGGTQSDPDPGCMQVARQSSSPLRCPGVAVCDPRLIRVASAATSQMSPFESDRLADRLHGRRKDTTWMPAAELLPDPTRSCELSSRGIAIAANPCEVSTQPMHVSPAPDIALTRERRQSIKATTCRRQVAALDLQPGCLNNPFGLQNPITTFQNVRLSLLQDPLSLLKRPWAPQILNDSAAAPERLTRERRQISDSKFRLTGAKVVVTGLKLTRGKTPERAGIQDSKTTTCHPLGPRQRSRQMRTRPAHDLAVHKLRKAMFARAAHLAFS